MKACRSRPKREDRPPPLANNWRDGEREKMDFRIGSRMMPTRIAKRCLTAIVGVSAVTLALAQAESSDPRRVPPRQSRFLQPPADRAPAASSAATDAPLPSRTGGRKAPLPGLQMPATWDNVPVDATANEPPLPKSKTASSSAQPTRESANSPVRFPEPVRKYGEPTLADAAQTKLDPPPLASTTDALAHPTASETSNQPNATADAPLPAPVAKVTPAAPQSAPTTVARATPAARRRNEPTSKITKKAGAKTPLQVVTESPTSTFGVRRPADKRPTSKTARSKTSSPVIEVAALPAEPAPLVVAPAPQIKPTPQVTPAPLVVVPSSDPVRADDVALEAPLPAPLVVRPQVAVAPKPVATKPAAPTSAPSKPVSEPLAVAAGRPQTVQQPTLAPPAPQVVASKPATTASPVPTPQPTVAARQSEPTSIVVAKPATPAMVIAEAPLVIPQPSPVPAARPTPIAQVTPTPAVVVTPAPKPFVEVPTPLAVAPSPPAQTPTLAPPQVVVSKPVPTVPTT